MKSLLIFVFFALVIGSIEQADAWTYHHYLTHATLTKVKFNQSLVAAKTLDAFLRDNVMKISERAMAFREIDDDKYETRLGEFQDDPTVETFVRLLRLNPQAEFPLLLRCVNPECGFYEFEALPESEYPEHADVLPEDDMETKFVVVPEGAYIEPLDILATASDEPDWGMDLGLFNEPDYSYKQHPLAEGGGLREQAPFHMMFLHEDIIMRNFFDSYVQSYLPLRVRHFYTLAKIAFENGERYWGYRFLGWALHYVGDAVAPYHSTLIPQIGIRFYLKYLFSSDKTAFIAENSNMIANRHLIFEQLIAYLVMTDYRSEVSLVKRSLKGGTYNYESTELSDFLYEITGDATKQVSDIDVNMSAYFDQHLVLDPTYDVTIDPSFRISDNYFGFEQHQDFINNIRKSLAVYNKALVSFVNGFLDSTLTLK